MSDLQPIEHQLDMEELTISGLRKRIFRVFDQIIESGNPVVIRRKGFLIRISLEQKPSKLDRLQKRDTIVGDPKELLNCKTSEWNHTLDDENAPSYE